MANTFNDLARSNVREVGIIHDQVSDFIDFLRQVKSDIGTSYDKAVKIPPIVTRILVQKAHFDSLNISGSKIKSVLEKDRGYDDWTATHTADFDAIFTKITTLRTLVENNIAQFPPTYNASHQLQFVTANQATQTALTNQIDDILSHAVA